jgi:Cu(I)/Ag(I) efflux system membrane fusion protein
MSKSAITAMLIVIAAAAGGGYWFGRIADPATSAASTAQKTGGQTGERKILYWHDPMYPQHKFDGPGKSPFMDMDLVPVYADETRNDDGIQISPRITQNFGVRLAPVQTGTLARTIETVGTVGFDEHRIQAVESRAAGWVERLHARAENDPIKRGQILAEIYAPEIHAAQEELLLALRHHKRDPSYAPLTEAARTRLSLLGLTDRQIRELEATGKSQRRTAIHSPLSGVVAKLNVREGQQVAPGMIMFEVADLSTVWVSAEVVENQAAWVTEDRPVVARVAALPGKVFKGKVEYISPQVMRETRTLTARIALKNPRMELKPGMFADLTLHGEEKRNALLVPSEAVIRTGSRSVVILAEEESRFRPLEVTTGMEADGKTEVLSGVEPGQQVVASGQFLIDSEASLRGALGRLEGTAEQ